MFIAGMMIRLGTNMVLSVFWKCRRDHRVLSQGRNGLYQYTSSSSSVGQFGWRRRWFQLKGIITACLSSRGTRMDWCRLEGRNKSIVACFHLDPVARAAHFDFLHWTADNDSSSVPTKSRRRHHHHHHHVVQQTTLPLALLLLLVVVE